MERKESLKMNWNIEYVSNERERTQKWGGMLAKSFANVLAQWSFSFFKSRAPLLKHLIGALNLNPD